MREERGRRVHRLSLPGVPRSESARIAAIRWSDEEERGGGGGDPVDAPRSRSTRSRRRQRRRRSALNHPCPFTGAPWNARGVQAPRRHRQRQVRGLPVDESSSWTRYTTAAAAIEVNDRCSSRGSSRDANRRGENISYENASCVVNRRRALSRGSRKCTFERRQTFRLYSELAR